MDLKKIATTALATSAAMKNMGLSQEFISNLPAFTRLKLNENGELAKKEAVKESSNNETRRTSDAASTGFLRPPSFVGRYQAEENSAELAKTR